MGRKKVRAMFLVALVTAVTIGIVRGVPLELRWSAFGEWPSSFAVWFWGWAGDFAPLWIPLLLLWFGATKLGRETRPISDVRAMTVMASAALTLFWPVLAWVALPLALGLVRWLVKREDRSGLDFILSWFALSTGFTLLLAKATDWSEGYEVLDPLVAQFPLFVALIASRCLDGNFKRERGWLLELSVPLLLVLGATVRLS